jgi:hypothetical protein
MRNKPARCKHGHAFDGVNTYIRPNGSRACKRCALLRTRRRRAVQSRLCNTKRDQAIKAWTPNLSRRELAWAAGLFEGEGTVTIATGGRARRYTRLVVTLSSTDREIIDFMQSRWAGSVKSYQPSGNAKLAHSWLLSGSRAGAFIGQVLPFVFTNRVKAKMNLAIEAQSTKQKGTRKNCVQYRAEQESFRLRMRELNKRGVH